MAGIECINGIQKELLRNDLKRKIDERVAEYGRGIGDSIATTVVIRELTEESLQRTKWRKYKQYLQMTTLQDALKRADENPDHLFRALASLYRNDIGGMRQHSNIEMLTRSLIAEANAKMPALAALRPKLLAMQIGTSRRLNADIRRAAMGLDTADATARAIAKEMHEVITDLVDRFRAAGGELRKLDGWFLPQSWNRFAVATKTEDEWIAEMMGTLPNGKPVMDRSRMVDHQTGNPLGDNELREVLRTAYRSITTDGLNKWDDPNAALGTGSVANRRSDHRVLHFTPEGWIDMNQRYGDDDTINAFLNWQEGMAKDIAIMQTLGPNPNSTFEAIKASYQHRVGHRVGHDVAGLEDLHSRTLGTDISTVSPLLAEADDAVRSGTTASMLGGAIVMAIGDLSFQLLNRMLTGTRMRDVLSGYVKFFQNGQLTTEDAIQQMIVVDTILSSTAAQARFLGTAAKSSSMFNRTPGSLGMGRSALARAGGFLNQASHAVLEKTLLTPFTNAGRLASLESQLFQFGRDLGKSFDQLSSSRRAFLSTYGITPEMWNGTITRQTPDARSFGRKRLNLSRLRDSDPDLFRRVHMAMLSESEQAVISSNLATERMLDHWMTFGIGRKRRGTGGAVVANQLKMFKRFPAAAFLTILSGIRNPNYSVPKRSYAIGSFFLAATVLGGLALQLRTLQYGNDPLPMFDDQGNPDPRFWFTAMSYGGGVPVLGDFVLETTLGITDGYTENPRQRSLWDLSPSLSLLGSVWGEPLETVGEAVANDEWERIYNEAAPDLLVRSGKAAAGIFGGNTLYLKTALDRALWGPITEDLNPDDYYESLDARSRYVEQRDTDFYWPLDEQTPARAPDFENTNIEAFMRRFE